MNNHTPGPWTFTSEQILDDGVAIHDDIRCFHLQSGDTVVLDGCGCCESPRLDNPADAHLIAAAPDLLEALEHMLHRAHPAYVGNDYMREKLIAARETARAAIAKAKGEV